MDTPSITTDSRFGESGGRPGSLVPSAVVLLGILGITAGVCFITEGTVVDALRLFLGFFLIAFGAFKVVRWRSFVTAFSRYDLVARHFVEYAYAFPLIEIALGFSFILSFQIQTTALFTLLLGVVSALGVGHALVQKTSSECASLGTVFCVPLTYLSFVKDLGLAIAALLLLFLTM